MRHLVLFQSPMLIPLSSEAAGGSPQELISTDPVSYLSELLGYNPN
jgi:hypothetical protein